MLQPYREEFNRNFAAEKYAALQKNLDEATRTKVEFRVAETPVFFDRALLDEIAAAGIELTRQLVESPAYMRVSAESIPAAYNVRGESAQPHFMTVDFGLVRDADGVLQPRLVEMQAFPSVFGYQDVLSREYVATYGLDKGLNWYLGGHDEASYWELLRRVIVAEHDPKQVVLMEVEPDGQKTLPDFKVYEDRLGIVTVDIAKIRQEGRKLFYQDGAGEWVRILRIFNRAIVDEIERKGIRLGFDPTAELDVEWAGHPNWFFRISKFSLPYLDHPSVPKAVFLDAWFRGEGSNALPVDRSRILLKPLYSFAGKGIQFAPSDEELRAIPAGERSLYLLQERVSFEPVVETPFGMTQAEIRVMYVWPDGGVMEPVISLVRMGRGLMMGVDHNRNQEWVGGSAALFPDCFPDNR
jgi:hypothetical protein